MGEFSMTKVRFYNRKQQKSVCRMMNNKSVHAGGIINVMQSMIILTGKEGGVTR